MLTILTWLGMSHAQSLVGKVTEPLELRICGDLLALIEKILAEQGPDSAQISKAKGHADESMVPDGRMLDKIGDDLADRAADFGRRRVPPAVIDSKRMVHSACTARDSLIPDSHRFFIAIVGEAANRDGRGGTSIHSTVGSAGVVPERRRVLQDVREFAWVPGTLLGFGMLVQLAGWILLLVQMMFRSGPFRFVHW